MARGVIARGVMVSKICFSASYSQKLGATTNSTQLHS